MNKRTTKVNQFLRNTSISIQIISNLTAFERPNQLTVYCVTQQLNCLLVYEYLKLLAVICRSNRRAFRQSMKLHIMRLQMTSLVIACVATH